MSRQELTREGVAHQAKIGFLIHAGTYVAVNAGLAALNLTRNPDKQWFWWVLGGWGLGVALHGALVFRPGGTEAIYERRQKRLARRAARR